MLYILVIYILVIYTLVSIWLRELLACSGELQTEFIPPWTE